MIINGNVMRLPLSDKSVHLVVTSPPYWSLRSYLPDSHPLKPLELGAEVLHDCLGWATGSLCGECYVCHMVQAFREVRRVLRDDGTCWLNLGDSYVGSRKGAGANGKAYAGDIQQTNVGSVGLNPHHWSKVPLKPKNLAGIPWRVALALQADGWWLRSDIPWVKRNAMPGSQKDRPTVGHEYLFLLSKSERYFYDPHAIKMPVADSTIKRLSQLSLGEQVGSDRVPGKSNGTMKAVGNLQGRTRKTTDWWLESVERLIKQTQSRLAHLRQIREDGGALVDEEGNIAAIQVNIGRYSGNHSATFPPDLIVPCILSGTSQKGVCPRCGNPWERVVKRKGKSTYRRIIEEQGITHKDMQSKSRERGAAKKCGAEDWGGTRNANGTTPRFNSVSSKTIGWRPTCDCNADWLYGPESEFGGRQGQEYFRNRDFVALRRLEHQQGLSLSPVPAIVFDPFLGSGTTGWVCNELGRSFAGLEVYFEFLKTQALLRAESKQTTASLETLPLFRSTD